VREGAHSTGFLARPAEDPQSVPSLFVRPALQFVTAPAAKDDGKDSLAGGMLFAYRGAVSHPLHIVPIMSAAQLAEFSQRIDTLLAASGREPQLSEPEVGRYMQQWGQQQQQFEAVAARITNEVIRPRFELLQGHLPQARLARDGQAAHCACWIGYSSRFPASMKIEFTVEPDASLQQAVVRSEVYLVPAFVRYDAHDKFVVRLDSADDSELAKWTEDRIIAALDTYLRLDRGSEDADDEPVVDPVCGMRLRRSSAAATADYRGHPYFFCTEACQRKFAAAPEQFVQVVTE